MGPARGLTGPGRVGHARTEAARSAERAMLYRGTDPHLQFDRAMLHGGQSPFLRFDTAAFVEFQDTLLAGRIRIQGAGRRSTRGQDHSLAGEPTGQFALARPGRASTLPIAAEVVIPKRLRATPSMSRAGMPGPRI